MTAKHFCDKCGKEGGVGRVTGSFAVSQPHGTKNLPQFDLELCPECLYELATVVSAMTTKRKGEG